MKNTKTSLSIALGTTLLSGFATTSAQAESFTTNEVSPFAMTELTGGYMQIAEADTTDANKPTIKKTEGSCGEGKCGEKMKMKMKADKKAVEGKCGDKKMTTDADKKATEGKCGDKKMTKEGDKKVAEGKCGDKKMTKEATATNGSSDNKK